MSMLRKYYIHTRLRLSGKLKHREVAEAKVFLIEQFSACEIESNLSDLLIQKRLVSLMQSGSKLAQTCLRCYISNATHSACLDLAHRFNLYRYFSSSELLSYVLDDINPLQTIDFGSPHTPFAIKILRSFDPQQSSLSYWTKRLVSQHPELNRLLNERGIYIASDWAILNQASAAQVKRLLSATLTEAELQRAMVLLDCFHAVYRADRLQQNASVGKRCLDPSEAQIQRMVALFQAQQPVTAAQLLRELRVLAARLRRAKRLRTTSLDQLHKELSAQPSLSSEEIFLSNYDQISEICLLEAIHIVLQQRLAYLQTRRSEQAAQFHKALFLFFVQNKSMGEIAPLIGLKQQFQVTRLLTLKQLRDAISEQYVALIQPKLQRLLAEELPAEALAQLHLEPLLIEMSQQIVAENTTECYSAHRHAKSLFSLCICRILQSYWQCATDPAI
jgi:hypothetical protein